MKYKVISIILLFFLTTSLVMAEDVFDFENNFDNWEEMLIKIREDEIIYDITYKKIESENITLDIYYPFFSIEEKYPVVIFIHGGGFIIGEKGDVNRFRTILDSFLEEGWVVVSVNYRLLSRGVLFPENLEDVKSAVEWVFNNAEKYELNTDSIGLWGSSAGGNLALMTALTYQRPIDFVISFAGPTDLLNENLGIQKKITEFIIGKQVNNDLLRQASPLHYLDENIDLAPILIIHGRNDMIVPYAQAEVFYDRVREITNECKLISLNSGHTLSPAFHDGLREYEEDIINFIKKYF